MSNNPKNLILLTGAGFTHNFGGFLAREMWSKIFNNPLVQANSEARSLLLNDPDFESVYTAKMQYNEDVIKIIRQAVVSAYKDLDNVVKGYLIHYGRGTSTELDTHGIGSLISFLSERGSDKGWFFTLNQDLFMERFKGNRSPGALFTQPLDRSEGGDINPVTLPSESELNKIKTTLNNTSYIKLHGSYGWISSKGGNQMVIGKNKVTDIAEEPLLKWYMELFESAVFEGNKKLLVIGYGFKDEHINHIILKGIKEYNLGLYIINPSDPQKFKKQLVDNLNNYDSTTIWEGLKGYFPYSLREIFPSHQNGSTVFDEIKKVLIN